MNTGDGVKIEALMMKTVSAALLMWLVSILVPLRRCVTPSQDVCVTRRDESVCERVCDQKIYI